MIKFNRKSLLGIALGGVILLSTAFIGFKFYSKVKTKMDSDKLMIASLYEAYNIRQTARIDSAKHHVLFLGNSITHHAPASTIPGADPFWEGDWGMCASRKDSDYVRRIEALLHLLNPNTTVEEKNIAEYENDFSIDLDSLIGGLCKGKDLIVLKIGENVKDEEGYYAAFKHLTEYCLKFTDNVMVAGAYWKAPKKEEAMVRVAREKNLKYVPLFWIYELYEDEVKAHVGDTIYNIKGKPYPIKTDFIITHPNDKGMKMIADEIYKNIELWHNFNIVNE